MGRNWKSNPAHLPGWNQYERDVLDAPVTPPKSKAKRRATFRNHHGPKPKRSDRVKKSQPRRRTGIIVRKLLVETPVKTLYSTWKRVAGRWHCTRADSEIDWFTRAAHPHVVESWIRTQKFTRKWLPDSLPATATNKPDGRRPSSRTGGSAVPSSSQSDTHGSPALRSCIGLAQNGLTSPRCLIPGSVPGISSHGSSCP